MKNLILTFIVFVLSLVLAVAIWSPQTLGAEPVSMTAISQDGSIIIQIYPTACLEPTRSLVKDEYKDQFHKAQVITKAKVYKACWVQQGTEVIVIDSEGDGVKVPAGIFKPTESM
ncbi:MAG: hypothetical protein KGJ90_06750 [Patescibacteria group bacterium]|nr:hypothetical protein [Patescibacteria group bacterium]